MNSDNDIYSKTFQSKTDPYFTSKEKEAKGSYYTRWGKDDARSALALTKPLHLSRSVEANTDKPK
jgi:hypothetical protein